MASAAKEVKAELKAAREAIRQKLYKDALKHCKNALKLDKSNYNALLFFGKCASEMDQPDQARSAFRKAIEVDQEQPLAWQGLAALLEQNEKNDDFQTELLDVYDHLAGFYSSESESPKWIEIKSKQGSLFKRLQQLSKAVDCWESLAARDGNRMKWIALIVEELNHKESKTEEESVKFLEALAELTRAESLTTEERLEYNTLYIKQLMRKCQSRDVGGVPEVESLVLQIREECRQMGKRYPGSLCPLEILCQIHIHNNLDAEVLDKEVVSDYQELIQLNSEGVWAVLCQCQLSLIAGNLEKAGDVLSKVDTSRNVEAMCLLASLHSLKREDTSVVEVAKRGIKLASQFPFCHLLSKHLRLCLAQAYLKMSVVSSAFELYEELHDACPADLASSTGLAKCALLSNDKKKAEKIADFLLKEHPQSHEALALSAEVLLSTGCLEAAREKIDLSLSLCDSKSAYYFISAKVLWLMGGSARTEGNQCFTHFLQAAKLNPYDSDVFLYLGHFYQNILKDQNKARRCYLKSINLNPTNIEAGRHLGDLCESVGNADEAVTVYKKITSNNSAEHAHWAWSRLGRHQLNKDQYDDAVVSFQSVTKADPENKEGWELLGDAYEGRGAYIAAAKSFGRASQLDESCLYCLYRIASLKHVMGQPREAVVDFEAILEQSAFYSPALKGISESLLLEARNALKESFSGKAVDCVNKALHFLSRGIDIQRSLVSLWKLLGDCCVVLCSVSEEMMRKVTIPSNLLPENCAVDEKSGKKGLLFLAPRAYATGLQFMPGAAFLWHDLGIGLYCQSMVIEGDRKKEMLQSSLQALMKSVKLDDGMAEYWISLGVVSMDPVLRDFALAQHAFIRSIQLQPINAVAWSNLGVLYLLSGDKELAHEPFKKAQASDPDYVPAWIGQALIAEGIGNEDAMDLFRHTTELGVHTESQIGYAYWVCSTLAAEAWLEEPGQAKGISANEKAIIRASDCLARYTALVCDNPCAYNMYGFLLERQRLFVPAEKAYRKAVEIMTSDPNVDKNKMAMACANHARSLSLIGRHVESIALFNTLSPLSDFHDIAFLALALFKANKLKDSYQTYERALELDPSPAEKSAIFACLGMTAYGLQDRNKAKTLLFKSSQASPPCVEGILGLCSLGLMSKDFTLASAALAELVKLRDSGRESDANLASHITFMFTKFYLLQGNSLSAKNFISNTIRNYPDRAQIWKLLAQFLTQHQPEKSHVASMCAASAWKLSGTNVSEDTPFLVSLGAVAAGNRLESPLGMHWSRQSLWLSQKALHANPGNVKAWALFSGAVLSSSRAPAQNPRSQLASDTVKIAKALLAKVEGELKWLREVSRSELPALIQSRFSDLQLLQQWATQQVTVSLICAGQMKEAAHLSQQVIQAYSSQPHLALPFHVWLSYIVLVNASEKDYCKALANFRTSVCALGASHVWPWELLSNVYQDSGRLLAAKEALQQVIQIPDIPRGQLIGNLLVIAWLAIKCCLGNASDVDSGWAGLANECLLNVQKLDSGNLLLKLFRGILHYIGKNFRGARRCLDSVLKAEPLPPNIVYISKYFLVKTLLAKKETASQAKAVAEGAEWGTAKLLSLVP